MAGCSRGPFASACLAVAGSGTEEGRQALERWARRQELAHEVLVVHDAYPILACTASEGPGIALIAGTGSIAFGRNARGETARAGGWGRLLREEGSGHGIAAAALRAVTRAEDGLGPATELTERILAHFRVYDVRAVVTLLHQPGFTPARAAGLPRVVAVAATAGDTVAGAILGKAAENLASLTAAVARRLGLRSGEFPLGLAGSVLLHTSLVQQGLADCLARLNAIPSQVVLVEQPEVGAVRLARAAVKQS
jgi:N-acetylglucosamine kinase-like BadF-type ATPase